MNIVKRDITLLDLLKANNQKETEKKVKSAFIKFENRLDLALFLMELRDWRKSKSV